MWERYHLPVCECEDVVADFLPVFTPHTHEVVLTKSPSQFFSWARVCIWITKQVDFLSRFFFQSSDVCSLYIRFLSRKTACTMFDSNRQFSANYCFLDSNSTDRIPLDLFLKTFGPVWDANRKGRVHNPKMPAVLLSIDLEFSFSLELSTLFSLDLSHSLSLKENKRWRPSKRHWKWSIKANEVVFFFYFPPPPRPPLLFGSFSQLTSTGSIAV